MDRNGKSKQQSVVRLPSGAQVAKRSQRGQVSVLVGDETKPVNLTVATSLQFSARKLLFAKKDLRHITPTFLFIFR